MTKHKLVPANDQRLIWSGANALENDGETVTPWRLPLSDLELFSPEGLRQHGRTPAGVRLRFATDAKSVIFHTAALPAAANLDLYANGVLAETVDFSQNDTAIEFLNLLDGDKVLELWLHQTTPFQLKQIELSDGAELKRAPDRRPRWITYGSSISHCGAAGTPSNTWPGVVARKADLNLTCLGFGGQCHLDPMVAKLIGNWPADIVSIKVGINIYGNGSLNERSFLPALIGTIDRIREGHPATPFVVCSPIFSGCRESTENHVGMTLQKMRRFIEEAVNIFRDRGDLNIYYVDGLKLFGPEMAEFLPDDLHPNAEGYVKLGENFHREVFEVLNLQPAGR